MRERRLHPRFDVILPVSIQKQDVSEEGNIFDISQGGVQIGCKENAAQILVPEPNEVNGSNPIPVTLQFKLPTGLESLGAEANIVFCRRVAADEFRLGLEFTEMDEVSQGRLDGYIDLRMKGG